MHNGQKTRIAVSRVFHLSDARRPEPDYAKPKNFYLTQKRHARYAYVTDAKTTKNNALRASFYYYARLPVGCQVTVLTRSAVT